MADSFGDDGLSEDEGTQHSAQVISEPTGEPDELWKQVAGSSRHQIPAIMVCWRKTEPRAARYIITSTQRCPSARQVGWSTILSCLKKSASAQVRAHGEHKLQRR